MQRLETIIAQLEGSPEAFAERLRRTRPCLAIHRVTLRASYMAAAVAGPSVLVFEAPDAEAVRTVMRLVLPGKAAVSRIWTATGDPAQGVEVRAAGDSTLPSTAPHTTRGEIDFRRGDLT